MKGTRDFESVGRDSMAKSKWSRGMEKKKKLMVVQLARPDYQSQLDEGERQFITDFPTCASHPERE